jgi:UDP-glucuronate decarboxylase
MESDYIYPVNLGNPVEYSVNQIADIIIKKTESDSKIINQKLPSDDPVRRKPDISIARKILNWEPKIELQQGLDKTIEYFRRII